MKPFAKFLPCIAGLLCIACFTHAQILKDISNRIKQKSEQRANQKIDKGIDKGLDKVDNAAKDATKKKDSSATTSNGSNDNKQNNATNGTSNSTSNNADVNSQVNKSSDGASFKTYSKFDFVPGDKVIAYDDFSKDAVGDFPVAWNTNSSGEVVTASGQQGHWLMVRKQGKYVPEYIKDLPDNFTLEYDVLCNEKFNYYSPALLLYFLTGNNGKEVFDYSFIPLEKRSGVKIGIDPDVKESSASVESFENGDRAFINSVNTAQFNTNDKTKLHVAVWRQKQRLRVYFNEEKAFDLPRAFPADKTYSTLLFEIWGNMNSDNDRYIVGNIKLAVGAPDTRNKLITEGKFVTRGILFDVNSDKIRPESYGVMKDIANVLTENSAVRVKIIGHTDSDGSDADNLTLSKRRAESVKASLVSDFGIDGSRFETDGKGESQPVDKNTTSEGKANNRRVEFIKL
jgi:outer membrane protein OmpA-like peptidoglycan-associated protein